MVRSNLSSHEFRHILSTDMNTAYAQKYVILVVALSILVVAVSELLDFSSIMKSWKRSTVSNYVCQIVKGPRFIRGLRYIFNGPSEINDAYSKSNGRPFVVETPTNNHVLVSSKLHVEELINAPASFLSLHAVAKEMLQPKYTMRGFEWREQRGLEGTGFVRALRSLLTAHLPVLLPHLKIIIEQNLRLEIEKHRRADGTSHVRVPGMVKSLIAKVNSFVFFGEELSQNAEFVDAALNFPQDVIIAAELVRLVPESLAPLVAKLATRGHKASNTMFKVLAPVVEERLDRRAAGLSAADEPADCMQWLIVTSPRSNPWTVERMVGEIMAVWFSSVHQLAMTTVFALVDLCAFPDHVDALREEAKTAAVTAEGLPLLDSFLQESVRYNSIDAITCRRKAIAPFTFSDGFKVAVGDWVCIPQQAMMLDPQNHDDSGQFNGFRFVAKVPSSDNKETSNDNKASSQFTNASLTWLIWGSGKTVCPGRFYAAAIIKLVLVDVLTSYDCSLVDPKKSRTITWRSSIVPREDIAIQFKEKVVL